MTIRSEGATSDSTASKTSSLIARSSKSSTNDGQAVTHGRGLAAPVSQTRRRNGASGKKQLRVGRGSQLGEEVFEHRRGVAAEQGRRRDERVDVNVSDRSAQFRTAEKRAERYRDRPDPCRGQQRHDEVRPLGKEHADRPALCDSAPQESLGKPARLLLGIREREAPVRRHDVFVLRKRVAA